MPINPIHAILLHTNKILIIAGSGNCPPTQVGCPAGPAYPEGAALLDLATWNTTTMATGWDMFCNGMVQLPDGRVLIQGGTLAYGGLSVVGQPGETSFLGYNKASVFDPGTESFADVTPTAHGRWYPNLITLGDGSVMTTGGLDENGANNNTSEIWNGSWSGEINALPIVGWGDPKFTFGFPLYPRMHLLPNGHVFYSGPTSSSLAFDPSTQKWTLVAWTIYGGENSDRTYGTSVLLPLMPESGYDPRIMIMGGDNPAVNTTELIDLGSTKITPDCPKYAPCWVQGPNMVQPRVEMQATLLPDGKVLVDAGSAEDEDASTASLKAQLYDPTTNKFSSAGANAYPRLYHNVQLLLPDGTVLLAGGNPSRGIYEPHVEMYEPPYLFNVDGSPASRPRIASSPATITYGSQFTVHTPDEDIAKVVLMRPGADTHSFDMDQRYVGLVSERVRAIGGYTVEAPPNSNVAPSGYYMLFLVSPRGTPSIASWVQLTGPVAAAAKMELHPERVPHPSYFNLKPAHRTEAPLEMRKEMHIH
jgi:hypothetical protein